VERIRALYDGNLRYADSAVGRLLEALRELDLLESSIVWVTSDHGESLGEHGTFGHGATVDREQISIPQIARFPAAVDLRGHFEEQVGVIDSMPTILAALGVEIPDRAQGRNVLATDRAIDAWARPLVSIASDSEQSASVVVPGFKYSDLGLGGERLLRLPDQERGADVRATHPVTFAYLRFQKELLTDSTRASAEERGALSERDRAALEALGYLVE
jgi:hypothetical protein